MALFSRDPWRKLKKALGAENVLDRPEDLMAYSFDASYTAPPGLHDPELVVMPGNIEQVALAVREAARAGLPVVPRGKGTGMSAGSVPLHGGMVLGSERLTRLFGVNPTERWLHAEVGLTTEQVKREAARHRLLYPPDPSSARISALGGNLAENAGGLRCVKYGTTRDYVLGLRLVTPDGEIVSTGSLATSPDTLDLTPLYVGSEGLLGMIVEAQLALLPQPPATHTLLAHFPSSQAALETVTTILAELVPSVFEFIDDAVIEAISAHDPYPFPEGTRAALLLETDGEPEQAKREMLRIREVLEEAGALRLSEAKDATERERLWELRRLVSPALSHLASGKMNEDVVVPIGRLSELLARVQAISAASGVRIPIYGHCGDGNLHLNAMYDAESARAHEQAEQVIVECFRVVVELGGSISGEHGIGASKQRYMSLQFSEDELALFAALKQQLDPEGRFNPGKLLPTEA